MRQKNKIRKSIARRFRITKNGKVIFRSSHMRHLRRNKRKGWIREQKIPKVLTGAMAKKVKRMMGK